jgi:hypothetical protein
MLIIFLTTTTIILATIIALVGLRAAARYHRRAVGMERAKRMTAMHALELLALDMQTAYYARDYYRAALTEIINITDDDDEAGSIARRFMALDDRHGADA